MARSENFWGIFPKFLPNLDQWGLVKITTVKHNMTFLGLKQTDRSQMSKVPQSRIQILRHESPNPKRDYVLYWMSQNRRFSFNFALDRSIEHANELKKPLLIVDILFLKDSWASDRHHQFALQSMADLQGQLSPRSIQYYPFVEKEPEGGKELLRALCKHACVLITDGFPTSAHIRKVKHALPPDPILIESIDSNGLFPIKATKQIFKTAYSFRRFLQKNLIGHIFHAPDPKPLTHISVSRDPKLLQTITQHWTRTNVSDFLKKEDLSSLSIDHEVEPCDLTGGEESAQATLSTFLDERLPRYDQDRNRVDVAATSGLSPFLQFGNISVHDIFQHLAKLENWTPDQLSEKTDGKRSGWWGMGSNAESFLDELITWREIGFNRCALQPTYDRFDTLPSWAQETLAKHSKDPRPHLYTLRQLEMAQTHDALWNAAQNQLRTKGIIHNYMRMLWGKKILEWSPSPQKALKNMIHLNDKYALDGQNPNSYSGIFWILGRFDRAWGPERPIFGKVRYMSSENTQRKMNVKPYLQMFASKTLKAL